MLEISREPLVSPSVPLYAKADAKRPTVAMTFVKEHVTPVGVPEEE